jgi:hypothetical protein
MKPATLTVATLLATATAFRFPDQTRDDLQVAFNGHKSKNPDKLYDRFVQICEWHGRGARLTAVSAPRNGIDIYLQDQVEKMYPGRAVTATSEYGFDLHAWAGASKEPVLVRELPDIKQIKRTFFLRPRRRRDGDGTAVETSVFGGWQVAWRDAEYDVIMATVRHSPRLA